MLGPVYYLVGHHKELVFDLRVHCLVVFESTLSSSVQNGPLATVVSNLQEPSALVFDLRKQKLSMLKRKRKRKQGKT